MTEPSAFRPPAWARGPHQQTLLARLLRSAGGPPYERVRWDTPDGDFLDLDIGPDPAPGAPVVLILHGLEGSSRRSYVRNVGRELLLRGVRPIALNFRGCSGEPNRAVRFYHSGETEDPTWVLGQIRARFPGRRLGAMAFSLGGNVLLKLIGERADGGAALLDTAVAMSVPYDLEAGCAFLERTRMGSLYTAYFLHSLRGKVAMKASRLAEAVDVGAVAEARTIRRFDDLVTAPLAGFRDASEYYARSSCNQYLAGIRVPTLLIHAEDDPFLPSEAIPTEGARANPHITLSLHARGGHVGFLTGQPWKPAFWADVRTAEYLAQRLGASAT